LISCDHQMVHLVQTTDFHSCKAYTRTVLKVSGNGLSHFSFARVLVQETAGLAPGSGMPR
jgi:hypothetical protein